MFFLKGLVKFSRYKIVLRACCLTMSLMLVLVLLSVVYPANTLPCGGIQNVYVCHPRDPTFFQICIGDTQYTMKCPGGLHFNRRTQTCDWPRNADCRTHFTSPPPTTRRTLSPTPAPSRRHRNHNQGVIRYEPKDKNNNNNNIQSRVIINTMHNDNHRRNEKSNKKYKNPYLGRNPYTKRFRYRHRHFNPFNSIAAATGPKKAKPSSNRERNVVDDLYKKSGHSHQKVTTNTSMANSVSNKKSDKWALAHNYPWWAARSSTPAGKLSSNAQKVISTTPRGYSSRRSYNHRRHKPINRPAAGGPMDRLSSSLKPVPRQQAPKPQLRPVKLNDEDSKRRPKTMHKAVRKTGKVFSNTTSTR